MTENPDHAKRRQADAAPSRGAAALVIVVMVMLVAVATFGWRHYRSAGGTDPQVEIAVPSRPAGSAGAGTANGSAGAP